MSGQLNLWRKQLLPIGTVPYRGRELLLDRLYLRNLVEAFNAPAFDVVPFQMADASGTHTSDPARCRGEVLSLELENDGLYAVIALTEEGEAVIRAEPSLGVAPRIVEKYRHPDGREFPAALQHVMGRTAPMLTDLEPWQRAQAR